MNQVVLSAVERYVRAVKRERLIEDLQRFHGELVAQHGVGSDSTPIIREFRDKGRGGLREDPGAGLR